MNKTRYSATEFGRNKPMNFRPSGTLTDDNFARCKYFGKYLGLGASLHYVGLK